MAKLSSSSTAIGATKTAAATTTTSTTTKTEPTKIASETETTKISFSHIELYADQLDNLDAYKIFENQLNDFNQAMITISADQEKKNNDENQQHTLLSLQDKRRIWNSIEKKTTMSQSSSSDSEEGTSSSPCDVDSDDHGSTTNTVFVSHGRDVVKQLLGGLGFRITGIRQEEEDHNNKNNSCGDGGGSEQEDKISSSKTRSVLITSPDPDGVQIVITSMEGTNSNSNSNGSSNSHTTTTLDTNQHGFNRDHYDIMSSIQRFRDSHSGRPGIGVLGFIVNGIEEVKAKYEQHHPALLASCREVPVVMSTAGGAVNKADNYIDIETSSWKVLEVFAYYNNKDGKDDDDDDENDNPTPSKVADFGTILRFVEPPKNVVDPTSSLCYNVLGLQPVPANFGSTTTTSTASTSTASSSSCMSSMPAYCDHWVSNVYSRIDFIQILYDTLGFTPKVDFNAGVVAAGEAQIESTVTGNTATVLIDDNGNTDEQQQSSMFETSASFSSSLRDQSQVYLPINNALSNVGHVYGFLEELGQGVQHVASRVSDLVDFVQRANDRRNIIGEGFTFLRIPRSYYGVLTIDDLTTTTTTTTATHETTSKCTVVNGEHHVQLERSTAECIMDCLIESNAIGNDGAIDLDLSPNQLDIIIMKGLQQQQQQQQRDEEESTTTSTTSASVLDEYISNRDDVLNVILQSRYRNLLQLLHRCSNISEETYLGIVRNQILVDIQGDDLLYQIFTSNILQRNQRDEAPFFEFIQRVCSGSISSSSSASIEGESCNADCNTKKTQNHKNVIIRPGCGGFGIRNFLTLFLSIEVSKAMEEVTNARLCGDIERQQYAQCMVDTFTSQLDESNPILTAISDAMTQEGYCQEQIDTILAKQKQLVCMDNEDDDNNNNKENNNNINNEKDDYTMSVLENWKKQKDEASKKKSEGNQMLMECSSRYNDIMKSIREKELIRIKNK